MTTEPTKRSDEAEIQVLLEGLNNAVCAKDVDRIMVHYATDAVVFDVKPPFQTKGADAWRRTWEECLPYFPDSFGIETRDLKINTSGDLGFVHRLWIPTGVPEDHPARAWLRNTIVCKRNHGRWKIVHDHWSVPFDPETSKAVLTRNA
jgi:ketosteroid isomerase-like protein